MEIDLKQIAAGPVAQALAQALKAGQSRPAWTRQFAAAGKVKVGKPA